MLHFFICFTVSFLVAFAALPTIIRLAKRLSFFDEPGERKHHTEKVPLLGGVAVFAATIFTFTIWAAPYFENQHLFIIASLIIIFFFGLRDDIAPLAPVKKLFGQVIASLIVILFCDVRFEGLHGLFGIHNLSWWMSVACTVFVMLFIINSFNLIDGIDGLSSGLGIISSLVFGLLFYVYGNYLMAVLAFSLCGALSGFIPYNFYKAKIFMGDTGTMTVGFILSIFAVYFMELTRTVVVQYWFNFESAPSIVLSMLIIPVVDMMRVFVIRIVKLRSPFAGDRNHIHHRLLQLGLNPAQSCLVLFSINIAFILSAWYFRYYDSSIVFYSILFSAFLLAQLPYLILKLKRQKQVV
jgi:UDP-N-acetylmuramyl pentapeptide phosphotransferase/UDP-N-acetylglucosamine-1-phosphate transferase